MRRKLLAIACLIGAIAWPTLTTADAAVPHVSPLGQVTEFATASGATQASVKVGRFPTGIVLAPNGDFIYVQNFASDTITQIPAAGRSGPIRTLHINGQPTAMAVTPNSQTLYVGMEYGSGSAYNGQVLAVRTSNFTRIRTIPVASPQQIVVAPAGKLAYVLGMGPFPEAVTPIVTATNRARSPIVLTRSVYESTGMVMTPNGRYLYVVSAVSVVRNNNPSEAGRVTPILLPGDRVLKPIPVGRYPDSIVATPGSREVYVSSRAGVTPIRTASNTAARAINAGLWPGAMVVTPNGKTLYVTDAASDVYPINTVTNTAGSPIFFGYNGIAPLNSPGSISVTPNGQTVYVVIGPTGSPGIVMPIATATNTLGSPIDVSPDPLRVVVAPDGKTAYTLDQISTSG